MRTTIKGRNDHISDRDRDYVDRKLGRLDRMLDDRSEAIVELRREQRSDADRTHIVDVTLVIDGRSLRGNATAATYRAAVDEVVDKLERRTVEHKQRPRHRARAGARQARTVADPTLAMAEPKADADEVEPLIVKTKRFAVEPMFEEDAVSRMEELGHAFFIFVNAESERVAVIYRRRDGRYGLIEPVIGEHY